MKHFYAQPNMVGPLRYFISLLTPFLLSTGARNGALLLAGLFWAGGVWGQCTPNTLTPSGNNFCIGVSGPNSDIIGNNVPNTQTYLWQVNINNTGWVTALGASTVQSYVLDASYRNTAASYQFRRIVTDNAPLVCTDTSITVTITISADPTVFINASVNPVCLNGAVTLTPTITGASGITPIYDWERSLTLAVGYANAPAPQVNPTYLPSTAVASPDYFYRLRLDYSTTSGCNDITSTGIQVVVADVVPPVISTCPKTRDVVGCTENAITGPTYSTIPVASTYSVFSDSTNQGIATDNCSIFSVTYQDVLSGACPVVTRTWTVSDGINATNCIQTINIKDTEQPVIATTATSGPLGCNPTVTAPVFTVTDNCAGTNSISAVITTTGPSNTGCAYTQTWNANYTDPCNNKADQVSVTYTWTQDLVAPTFPKPSNQTLNTTDEADCPSSATISLVESQTTPVTVGNAPFTFTVHGITQNGPTVYSDGCSPNDSLKLYVWNINNNFEGNATDCQRVIRVQWRVVDACGNFQQRNQDFTIIDNSAPILVNPLITCDSLNITEVNECLSAGAAFNATTLIESVIELYKDNCSSKLLVTVTDTIAGENNTNCSWSFGYEFTIADSCENAVTCIVTRSGGDTEDPILVSELKTCESLDSSNVNECLSVAAEFDAATLTEAVAALYKDDCSAKLLVTLTDTIAGENNTNCRWSFGYEFTISDSCENAVTCIVTRSGGDTGKPVLADVEVNCENLDIKEVNECLSAAAEFDATTLIEAVAALYKDNCSSQLLVTLTDTIAGENNTNCSWSFGYEFTISDSCENAVTCIVTRSGGDTEDPILVSELKTCESLDSSNVNECLSVAAEFNATTLIEAVAALYKDNCSSQLLVTLTDTIAGENNTNCSWSFGYEFTISDSCENAVTCIVTRSGGDTEDPILVSELKTCESLDSSNVNECLSVAAEFNATTLIEAVAALYKDNCSSQLLVTLTDTIAGENNTNCRWSFGYEFTIADSCENAVTCIVTRSGGDTGKPVLADVEVTCESLNIKEVNQCLADAQEFNGDSLINDVKKLYQDNCSEVTVMLSDTIWGANNTDCNWSFTYEFTISDDCENSTTCSVVRSGSDQNPPVIDSTFSANEPDINGYACGDTIRISAGPSTCFATRTITKPIWEDGCGSEFGVLTGQSASGGVTLSNSGDFVSGNFPGGSTTVTFTGTDECGNTGYCTLTIIVTDEVAPTIVCPTNITVEANDEGCTASNVNLGQPFANDNCPEFMVTNDAPTTFSTASLTTVTWTVTDIGGNTATCTQTVKVIKTLVASATITTPIACNGGEATVTASATGGTAATYLWSNSQTTSAVTVTAGTYTVIITDTNGCTASATVIVSQPSALSATTNNSNPTCFGFSNGNASVTATGGTAPYTFEWNSSPTQTGPVAFNVPAGTYTVTITDANKCTKTASVTLTAPAALTASAMSTPIACNGGTSTVTVTATGGTGVITGTGTFENVTAGTHTYTVTDGNNCTASTTIVIAQPAVLFTSISSNPILCNGGTTSATASASGGTAGYSYLWSNAQTTATATGLVAGTYTVIAKDTNNCTAIATVTLSQPTLLVATVFTSTNPTCDKSNGSASITASGGTGPYTYMWPSPITTSGSTATGLAAGTYTVTVKDNNLCTTTVSVVLTAPEALVITPVVVNPVCIGSNGSITLNTSGGTPNYQYSLNGGAFQPSNTFNVGVGTYTVLVKDDANCTATATGIELIQTDNEPPTITCPPNITTAVANAAPCVATGFALGSAVANDNCPNYIVTNDAPTSFPVGTSTVTYTVTQAGAGTTTSATCTQTIIVSAAPVSATITSATSTTICVGGSVDVSVNVIATGTYTLVASATNGTTTSTAMVGGAGNGTAAIPFTFTTPGTYTVSLTSLNDAVGCTATLSGTTNIIVVEDATISISPTATTVCAGGNINFSAVLTGGNGCTITWESSANLSGPWATVGTGETYTASNILANTYYRAVANCTGSGCGQAVSDSTLITVLPDPVLSITGPTTVCATDPATLIATLTGGIDCTINWESGASASGPWTAVGTPGNTYNTGDLAAGTHYFRAITTCSGNGCAGDPSNVTTIVAGNLTATITGGTTICQGQSANLTINITGSTVFPFTVVYQSNGINQPPVTINSLPYTLTVSPTANRTYRLQSVTDANGCSVSGTPFYTAGGSAIVGVNTAATVNAGNDQTICAGATATLGGTIGGAATSSTWTTSGTGLFNNVALLNAIYTPSPADITAGSVKLILTTNNPAGICPAVSDTMVLSITPPFTATLALAEGEDVAICAGESIALEITCTGSTAPWTFVYEVNGVPTTATSSSNPYSFMVSPTINTNITLISVVSSNGCLATVSGSVDIIVNEAPILSAVTTQAKCFGQNNGAIDLTVTNNIDESLELLTYVWSNSATTQDISGLGQGTYTVTVYAGNDCSTTATYTISQPDVLAVTNTVVNNNCAANQLGSIDLSVTGGTTPYSYLWSNNATTQDISGLANGNYTVTATDKNGCTTATSIAIIYLDNTPPEVTPAMPLTIECSASNGEALYAWLDQHGGATATDNYTPALELDWSDDFMELSNLCGATGTATVIFTVTDQCGLSSTTSATFTIIDNTPPTIVPAPNATEECGPNSELAFSNWLTNHGGVTATDACGSVTWSTVPSTPVLSNGCGATGTVTVNFIATDECGNSSSTSATFSIIDSTKPSITQAASSSTEECGPNANAAFTTWLNNRGGATATDICGSVTWSIAPSTPALSDGCGETGTVSVNFIATDECGNSSSTSATFSITDTTKPSITQAASGSTVECGPNASAAFTTWLNNRGGATATDICGSITWSTIPSTPALSDGCGATGTVTVNFIATDECGNSSSTSATFSITDTTKPSITLAASSSTVECGPSASAAFTTWLNNHGGATATDICGSITWSTDPSMPALSDGCGATGTVTVNFIASDDCGNSSSTSATFTITDTTKPSITLAASNSTVECGPNANTTFTTWLNNHGGATATDSCSGVTWSTLPSVLTFSDDCGATGAVTVTFIAMDDCGNSSTTSATFTIEDTTAPVLTDFPEDLIVECDGTGNTTAFNGWLNDLGGARAADACGSITWSSTYNALSDECGLTGTSIVTFKATDECGNTMTTTAKFTIADTTEPTFVFDGDIEDIEVNFSEIPDAPAVTASDLCGTATVELDELTEGSPCDDVFTLTRTWTATDDCDNSTSMTQVITILFDLKSGSITGDQTLCADQDPTALTSVDPGSGYPTITYRWEMSYNSSAFDTITGANAATYDPGVLTPAGTYQFRRFLVSSGTWMGDAFSCASIASNTVTINVQPLANISVTMSANADTICAGQLVTLTAVPVNTGINPTYVWKRDGVVIPSANAAILVLTATSGTTPSATQIANGDSITVEVTPSIEVACPRPSFASSNLDSVVVKPSAVPSVTIMTNTNPVCPEATSITFVANPTNGGINPVYQWLLNSSTVGINNDSLTLSTYNANDTVMVIMTPSSEICVSPAIDTSNKIIILVLPPTPLAGCKNVTVVLDTLGLVKITPELVNNGSNINCGLFTGSVSPASLSCKDVGPNLVILTVTDPTTGGLDTCHSIVTVRDEQVPVITCMPSFALSLGGTGTALLTAGLVLLDAVDNCGLLYTVSPNMFDCDDVDSLRTVTLTATDNGGNTATCSTTVLIRETVPPASANCGLNLSLPIPPEGITLNAVLLGITDNCTAQKDIKLTFAGNSFFGVGAIGTTVTVVYTMTDEFGNSSMCATFITFTSEGINKGEPPVNPTKMNQDRTNTAASKQAVELKVYPSPMLDQGYITYWLPEDGDVNIELWDVNARLIKTLQDAPMIGGAHAIQWQRETLSEGMYFVVLRVNGIPTAYKSLIISRL